MIAAGMDVARLNLSHGERSDLLALLGALWEAVRRVARRRVGVIFDLRGPEIRLGTFGSGPVRLEVTNPTQPCQRMEEAFPGLLKALHPEWRGGVTCLVLDDGVVRIGDAVEVLHAPPEHVPRLP